jgi:hypothetical protein
MKNTNTLHFVTKGDDLVCEGRIPMSRERIAIGVRTSECCFFFFQRSPMSEHVGWGRTNIFGPVYASTTKRLLISTRLRSEDKETYLSIYNLAIPTFLA